MTNPNDLAKYSGWPPSKRGKPNPHAVSEQDTQATGGEQDPEIEDLRARATALGIDFDPRTGARKLRRLIESHDDSA